MVLKSVRDIDRFRNFFTAQSCLRLKIKDTKTGKTLNIIIGNRDFAFFLAEEKGIRGGKTKGERDKHNNFLNNEYVKYMLENISNAFELDFEKLRKRTRVLVFDKAMNFDQLNVKNEHELVEKYFDFNPSAGSGMLKSKFYDAYTRDPGFIALLLELGYDVVWGDLFPNLNIFTRPFISTLQH